MPELPEVETTLRGIQGHILNQQIQSVTIRQPKLRWPIPQKLNKILAKQTILSCSRRAKYLIITLESGSIFIHLGMSGNLRIIKDKRALLKHDHVDIEFKNNTILRYNDPRRFGAILWTEDDPAQHPLLKNLGPEPLGTEFNTRYLYKITRNKDLPVKAFLMTNKYVVGVGNIYASEALFKCGISPLRPASELNQTECQALCREVKNILKRSIQQGGTTLKDFVNSDGKPGYFKQSLLVYGRDKEPCKKCKTPIISKIIRQRNSFYCPACQI